MYIAYIYMYIYILYIYTRKNIVSNTWSFSRTRPLEMKLWPMLSPLALQVLWMKRFAYLRGGLIQDDLVGNNVSLCEPSNLVAHVGLIFFSIQIAVCEHVLAMCPLKHRHPNLSAAALLPLPRKEFTNLRHMGIDELSV